MDDAVWNHAVFLKNRERLLTSDVAQQFFAAVTVQEEPPEVTHVAPRTIA